MYIVYTCTVFTVHCSICNSHWILYIHVHYTLYNVHRIYIIYRHHYVRPNRKQINNNNKYTTSHLPTLSYSGILIPRSIALYGEVSYMYERVQVLNSAEWSGEWRAESGREERLMERGWKDLELSHDYYLTFGPNEPRIIIMSIYSLSMYTIYCKLFNVHYTLPTIQCTLYTLNYSMYTVHCRLFNVHYTLTTIQCILYTIRCQLSNIHYTLHTIQCILYTIRCQLFNLHYTLPTIHCTLYNGHCTTYSV